MKGNVLRTNWNVKTNYFASIEYVCLNIILANKLQPESSVYFIQMAPLQPETKNGRSSQRDISMFLLPLSTHAQRYAWQISTSWNQKPKEPSKPSTQIRKPTLMGSFPKPLKPKPIQAHQSGVCCFQSALSYSQKEDAFPCVPIFIVDLVTSWFPPPTLNCDHHPRSRRID